MKTFPKLSVIMPNYNHAAFLPVSLGGILKQSVQPDEIIVLDDASTDNSVAIIQEFAKHHPHIRLERNEKNRGVVFGMNRGVAMARNNYVYFAAADDEVLPGLFEKLLTILGEFPEAAFSSGVSEWREVTTGLTWHMGVAMAATPGYLSPAQLVQLGKQGKLRICPSASIFNRESVLKAGGFIPELQWACDWFAAHVAASRQGLCFVPELVSVYNIRPTSFSLRQQLRSYQGAQREVLQRMLDLLNRPEYSDAAAFLRETGALFSFAGPMLRLMVGRARNRRFLSLTFLRQNLWYIFRMTVKKITPGFAAEWYFRLAGLKLRPSKAVSG
jgi:glycosyltransferase involved in cell wall biosynthesis